MSIVRKTLFRLRMVLLKPAEILDLYLSMQVFVVGAWFATPGWAESWFPVIVAHMKTLMPLWGWYSLMMIDGIVGMIGSWFALVSLVALCRVVSVFNWVLITWFFAFVADKPPIIGVIAPFLALLAFTRALQLGQDDATSDASASSVHRK